MIASSEPHPISEQEFAHARALLDAGRALPAHWYSAKHVWDAERKKLFRSAWLYFGHTSEVAARNSFATHTVATMPILVTRDQDDVLHAFFNTCRHRMHAVATGCGETRGLTCHYHGWRYKLNGELTGVPRSTEIFAGDAEGFDKKQFGLQRVSVDVWQGLVFVNADPSAPPLSSAMGEMLNFASTMPLPENLVVRHRDVRVVDVNWKTLVDNVIECYHCTTVHPELSANFNTSPGATVVKEFACGSAILVPPRAKLSGDEAFRRQHHLYFLPPTACYSCKGDQWALLVVVDPVTEHRSRLISVILTPESFAKDELEAIIESAALVNDQDIGASTSAQAGYDLDPGFDAYQLPHSEQSLRRFARLVLDGVA